MIGEHIEDVMQIIEGITCNKFLDMLSCPINIGNYAVWGVFRIFTEDFRYIHIIPICFYFTIIIDCFLQIVSSLLEIFRSFVILE